MKTIRFLIVVLAAICATFTAYSKDVKTRDEFIKYNDQGEIILHGKYSRDSTGRVIRYDVYDGKDSLQYYDIPYYKEDGSIIRSDTFAPDGSLTRIAVFFEKSVKVFDKDGTHLPQFDSSHSSFQKDQSDGQ